MSKECNHKCDHCVRGQIAKLQAKIDGLKKLLPPEQSHTHIHTVPVPYPVYPICTRQHYPITYPAYPISICQPGLGTGSQTMTSNGIAELLGNTAGTNAIQAGMTTAGSHDAVSSLWQN